MESLEFHLSFLVLPAQTVVGAEVWVLSQGSLCGPASTSGACRQSRFLLSTLLGFGVNTIWSQKTGDEWRGQQRLNWCYYVKVGKKYYR